MEGVFGYHSITTSREVAVVTRHKTALNFATWNEFSHVDKAHSISLCTDVMRAGESLPCKTFLSFVLFNSPAAVSSSSRLSIQVVSHLWTWNCQRHSFQRKESRCQACSCIKTGATRLLLPLVCNAMKCKTWWPYKFVFRPCLDL